QHPPFCSVVDDFRMQLSHFCIVYQFGSTINMKANLIVEEIKQQQANMRILDYISKRCHHTISAVFRVDEMLIIYNLQKTGFTCFKRRIAVTVFIARRNKDKRLLFYKLLHFII